MFVQIESNILSGILWIKKIWLNSKIRQVFHAQAGQYNYTTLPQHLFLFYFF